VKLFVGIKTVGKPVIVSISLEIWRGVVLDGIPKLKKT
jgi:hypothetical protein